MFNLNHPNNNDIYPKHKTVPVICSFDDRGQMRPLYVRINGEAFKICSSQEKTSFSHASVFQCEIADHGILKSLTLEYRYREHLWLMPK